MYQEEAWESWDRTGQPGMWAALVGIRAEASFQPLRKDFNVLTTFWTEPVHLVDFQPCQVSLLWMLIHDVAENLPLKLYYERKNWDFKEQINMMRQWLPSFKSLHASKKKKKKSNRSTIRSMAAVRNNSLEFPTNSVTNLSQPPFNYSTFFASVCWFLEWKLFLLLYQIYQLPRLS